ncbi:helix-turn-helix domain-containing protein [Paenibacillus alkaliterrae]|uniref:GH39 family glycosyl hydrolase n=1 Tax=Paenibacillus alkaliterrae TaxID=320909 RepID=UPI001F35C90F|nr:helix-turn-helix domain-containing protein [Paenibacillus alkaliterrae]MCF2941755.1 helix-turn-helix domain-containing protein [Paenibacillus alkaliterrae]
MAVNPNKLKENNQRQNVYFILNDRKENDFHHDSLEILFVLSGTIRIRVGNDELSMKPEDMIVINPYEIHHIHPSPSANFVSMMISTSFIYEIYPAFQDRYIDCKSFLSPENHQEQLNGLRNHYATIFRYKFKNESRFELDMYSEIFSLLGVLVRYFSRVIKSDKANLQKDGLSRIQSITNYINQNYQSAIVLSEIARKEFLTPQYLSRMFQKYMNMTLTQYITLVRLNHAYSELSRTDHTITEIAYNNGFKNVSSFIAYFRDAYKITPGEFRKKHNVNPEFSSLQEEAEIHDVKTYDTFAALLKYAEVQEVTIPSVAAPIRLNHIEADVSSEGKKLFHKWRNLINIGFAKDGLNAAIQNQLMEIQKSVGFRYLRFHGLLDDDMMVYKENRSGNAELNFIYVDMLLDFIISIGMLPYIELGFMPPQLAKAPNKINIRASVMSMPKDMGKWNGLVGELIKHCINRYGDDCVREWYFILWNSELAFNNGYYKEEQYNELYENTYRTIKLIDNKLRVGGPSKPDLLEFGISRNCIPDFIAMRCYSCVPEEEESQIKLIEHDEAYSFIVSSDEAFLAHEIDKVKLKLKEYALDKIEIVLDEWNSNIWQRDLCNDTCYKSAFIAKNIAENYDRISAFGYWTLSDFMEEVPLYRDVFHGGFGLFTHNSIRKSSFNAMLLLRGLGNRLIQKGDGYFITRDHNGVQILLYNYCHYDELYRHRHVTHMDKYNRYHVFRKNETEQFRLILNGMNKGEYSIRKYTISRSGGSAFDKWLEMGAPHDMRTEELTYLSKASEPVYRVDRIAVQENLILDCTLTPHEVQLIKISGI